jgi:DNA-binding MarR family transcriptional regulator
MTAPADFQTFKRQTMADQQRTAKTKEDFDFERLIRQALTGNEFLIYSVLTDFINDEIKVWCWPSITELQERAGFIDRKTVLKVIPRLEELGLLEVIRPPRNPHNQMPSQYRPTLKRSLEVINKLETVVLAKKTEWESKQGKNSTTIQVVEKIPVSSGKNPMQVVEKIHSIVNQINANQNNETNKDMAVSSEPGPTTIDLPDVLEPKEITQVLLPTVEAVNPGPAAPKEQDRGGVEAGSHIPHSENKAKKPRKIKAENPYTKDPRLLKWREIALEEDYNYWPSKQSQKLIIDHIPPNQIARWDATIRGWLRKNHKIINVEGMVKVFWFGFDAFYKGQADNKPLPAVPQVEEGVQANAYT